MPKDDAEQIQELRVRELAVKGFTFDYMARALGMSFEDFEKKYSVIVADAIEEFAAELTEIMYEKARHGKDAKVDARSAAYLLERFTVPPREQHFQVIGRKNQAMPVVIPTDEAIALPAPVVDDSIIDAVILSEEAEEKEAA